MSMLAVNRYFYAPTFIKLHEAASTGVYPMFLRRVARKRAVTYFIDENLRDLEFEDEFSWVHNVWKGGHSVSVCASMTVFLSVVTTVNYEGRLREARQRNHAQAMVRPPAHIPNLPAVAPQATQRIPAAPFPAIRAHAARAVQPVQAVAGPARVIGQPVAAVARPAPAIDARGVPMAAAGQAVPPARPVAQPARINAQPARRVAQPVRFGQLPRAVAPPARAVTPPARAAEPPAAQVPAALIAEASRAILNAAGFPPPEKFECGCCYDDDCSFVRCRPCLSSFLFVLQF